MLKGQKAVQSEEALRLRKIMRIGHVNVRTGIAIDGGAHVGSWTIEMAKYFKEIYAFEPFWESYMLLCENVINSELDADVTPSNMALLDKECQVKVVSPAGRKTSTAKQIRLSPGGPVEGIAIDSLDLEGCDLIKLDLEGTEHLALRGARKTIKKFHPFLIIEFNNLVRKYGSSEDNLEKTLLKMGYKEVWREGVDRGFKHISN